MGNRRGGPRLFRHVDFGGVCCRYRASRCPKHHCIERGGHGSAGECCSHGIYLIACYWGRAIVSRFPTDGPTEPLFQEWIGCESGGSERNVVQRRCFNRSQASKRAHLWHVASCLMMFYFSVHWSSCQIKFVLC